MYGHPELYPEAHIFKRFLVNFYNQFKINFISCILYDIVFCQIEIMEVSKIPIHNLKPALNLLKRWENELSQNTIENTELYTHMQEEMKKLRKNVGYTMQFHERFLQIICESKVFIYPELLPAIPFRFRASKASEYFPAED